MFQILRLGKSLELIMASFQLLNELDKVYLQSLNFNSTYSLLLRCPIILTRTIFDLVLFFFFQCSVTLGCIYQIHPLALHLT